MQVPGWLREDVFWAGSGRFRCGFRAGSRGPGVGSGLVTGGSANAWLCFTATSVLHLGCISISFFARQSNIRTLQLVQNDTSLARVVIVSTSSN